MASSMLPSGTITFLFSDIQGSTPLWEQHPEAMHHALARHNEIMHQVMAANNGRVFKIVGDEFQVAFTNPGQAVHAAVEAQRQLAEAGWPQETGPLLVRMGIHTGEAQAIESGDYRTSHTLNRVARISAAGHGGQILLSLVSAELARGDLDAAIQFRDLGEHYLKGMAYPEHIFQVEAPRLEKEFPPVSTLKRPGHNLPLPRTAFIGREREISQLGALMENNRLVTLTGIGGVGKTRMAVQTAESILDVFPDGVWWVALASISDPNRVVDAVGEVMSIREQADRQLIDTIEHELGSHHALLVLDNCEHLIEACAQLADRLLRNCPEMHILTTSREPLRVEGEVTFHVPSLSMPESGLDRKGLEASEAGSLFVERARAALPEFALTDSNSKAVAQICQRLDGIPLAIELAAARVPIMQVAQIASRLDSTFRLLKGGSRTTSARHQTLQATIDWSYQLLSAPEQKFFEPLSIFAGGWTMEATEVVCTDEDLDVFLALDLLTNLVDKSLVTLDRHPGKEPHYRFLEVVRQYAQDRLERSGMLPLFARKHLDFYLAFAERYAEEVDGENQVEALNHLEIERENLRSALAWSLGSPETAGESIRMVVALGRYWLVRGNLNEGRQWMSAALAQESDCDCPDERAVALNLMGRMAYNQSDYHASKAAWEESLEISQRLGETGLRGVHLALTGLAMVASEVGEYEDTIRLLHEALEISRRVGDGLSEADILRNLGWGVMRTGDYPQARAYLEQAEGLFRRYNERVGLSSTISGLGEVATRLGELEKAKTLLQEALALRRELDNKWGIGATLGTLAWVAMEASDLPAARQYLGESMEVRQELGDKGGIAWCLEKMAQVSQMQGGMQQAALLFGAAAALRRSIHSVIDLADQPEYEALLDTIRETLGEKIFQRKWKEGEALGLDQAVAAARQDPAE